MKNEHVIIPNENVGKKYRKKDFKKCHEMNSKSYWALGTPVKSSMEPKNIKQSCSKFYRTFNPLEKYPTGED